MTLAAHNDNMPIWQDVRKVYHFILGGNDVPGAR